MRLYWAPSYTKSETIWEAHGNRVGGSVSPGHWLWFLHRTPPQPEDTRPQKQDRHSHFCLPGEITAVLLKLRFTLIFLINSPPCYVYFFKSGKSAFHKMEPKECIRLFNTVS